MGPDSSFDAFSFVFQASPQGAFWGELIVEVFWVKSLPRPTGSFRAKGVDADHEWEIHGASRAGEEATVSPVEGVAQRGWA